MSWVGTFHRSDIDRGTALVTLTEGVVIAIGLVIGYWFVSVFLPHASADERDADRKAASERALAPLIDGRTRPPGRGEPTRPWHEVLEVDPSATMDDIRIAYEHKLSQYQPDGAEAMAPELQALAEARSVEIKQAYETATR